MWTTPRLALAALAFALLAATFSSASCNPTDESANTGAANGRATTATPAAASGGTVPDSSAAAPTPVRRGPTDPDPNPAPLPDGVSGAELTDLDGKRFKLSDYEGKVVVVNMWATWCGPCRREIPDLISIHDDYRGRDLVVVGLTNEDGRQTQEDVAEFAKTFKIDYRLGFVEHDAYVSLLQPGYQIPQTYVLGKDGRVLKKFLGASPQVGAWVRTIADQALL